MMRGQAGGRIVARLKSLAGQVSGFSAVVENDERGTDTLLEDRAVHGELSKVGHSVLSRHMETCVTAAHASGDESKGQEIIEVPLDVFDRRGGA